MTKRGSVDVHRNYPETAGSDKMRRTPIQPRRSYSDPGIDRVPPWMTPTLNLNQEYIDAGAAADKDTPLCWGTPGRIACRKMAQPDSKLCEECDR